MGIPITEQGEGAMVSVPRLTLESMRHTLSQAAFAMESVVMLSAIPKPAKSELAKYIEMVKASELQLTDVLLRKG